MGQIRNGEIAGWQNQSGIKPATGERAQILNRLSLAAYEMIRVIELERSGIRDGDGFWSGSDGLGGMMNEMSGLIATLDREYSGGTKPAVKAYVWETPGTWNVEIDGDRVFNMGTREQAEATVRQYGNGAEIIFAKPKDSIPF